MKRYVKESTSIFQIEGANWAIKHFCLRDDNKSYAICNFLSRMILTRATKGDRHNWGFLASTLCGGSTQPTGIGSQPKFVEDHLEPIGCVHGVWMYDSLNVSLVLVTIFLLIHSKRLIAKTRGLFKRPPPKSVAARMQGIIWLILVNKYGSLIAIFFMASAEAAPWDIGDYDTLSLS